jgi:hypothetical protein
MGGPRLNLRTTLAAPHGRRRGAALFSTAIVAVVVAIPSDSPHDPGGRRPDSTPPVWASRSFVPVALNRPRSPAVDPETTPTLAAATPDWLPDRVFGQPRMSETTYNEVVPDRGTQATTGCWAWSMPGPVPEDPLQASLAPKTANVARVAARRRRLAPPV